MADNDNDAPVSSVDDQRRARDQRLRQHAQERAARTADSARRIEEANQVFESHLETIEARIQTRLDRFRKELQVDIDNSHSAINTTVKNSHSAIHTTIKDFGSQVRELCQNTDASQNELYDVLADNTTTLADNTNTLNTIDTRITKVHEGLQSQVSDVHTVASTIYDKMDNLTSISIDAHSMAHQSLELNNTLGDTLSANQRVLDGFPEDLNLTISQLQQDIRECHTNLLSLVANDGNGHATVDSNEVADLLTTPFHEIQTKQDDIHREIRDGIQRTAEDILGVMENENKKSTLMDIRLKAKVDAHDSKLNSILDEMQLMKKTTSVDIGSPLVAKAMDHAMSRFTAEITDLLEGYKQDQSSSSSDQPEEEERDSNGQTLLERLAAKTADHESSGRTLTELLASQQEVEQSSASPTAGGSGRTFQLGTPRKSLRERRQQQTHSPASQSQGFTTPNNVAPPTSVSAPTPDTSPPDVPHAVSTQTPTQSPNDDASVNPSVASSTTCLETPPAFPATMSPIAKLVHQSHGVQPASQGTPYTQAATAAQTLGSKSRVTSQSSHLKAGAPPIDWLEISKNGPYSGSHDKAVKSFPSPPEKDDPDLYMQFYLILRGHLQSNGFHTDLIPCVHKLKHDVDLRMCPINPQDMVTIPTAHMSNNVDYSQWGCPFFWQNQHKRLGSTLYQGFVDRTGKCKERIPHFWTCVQRGLSDGTGCGWTILNALLKQFHSGIAHTMAPEYTDLIPLRPIMKSPSDRYDDYIEKYKNWLRRIHTCEDMYRTDSEWDFSIWFLEGLYKTLRDPFLLELRNMKLCARNARRQDLPVPPNYSIDSFADILIELFKLPPRVQISTSTTSVSHNASISTTITNNARAEISLDPSTQMDLSETSMWICPLVEEERNGNDNNLIIAGVSAIHGPRRNKARQLRPPELCSHKECGLRHSPDLCCICSSPHVIERCWHLIGLPEARKNVRDQYKITISQKQLESRPKDKKVQIAETRNIDIRTDVPPDLAPPEDRVAPATPVSNDPSPEDLQDTEEALLDMLQQESLLDTTYNHPVSYSSMVKITNGRSSDDPDDDAMVDIDYPDDGIEERLVPVTEADVLSRIPADIMNRNLGMQPEKPLPDGQYYFHVDTGCTDIIVNQALMDPDTVIDTSGTTLSAGTASDSPTSNGAVTAIGFCPLFFVTTHGEVEYIGCPNSMSVSGFPRNSFSLSHLRRLGYRASHHIGEHVIIYTPSGKQFAIPVITEGEQDYIVAHRQHPTVDKPPIPRLVNKDSVHNVVTTVALINLAGMMPPEGQFYLWHLRLGCIGPDALEALSSSGLYKGIPGNLKKPATFHCPICDRCKMRSVGHHPAQSSIITRKGVRFGCDFCFPHKISIRGYKTALILTEYTSSYSWVFLRQNREQPVDIILWFVLTIRRCLQLSCNVLRVDMEFFNNKVLLHALAKIHCQLEPTGGYNGAGNAKVENNSGLAKTIMRCMLVGGNKDPSYWCFALVHGIFLLNLIGRRILDYKSSQSVLFGVETKKDDITYLRVLFSRVHIKIHRTSRTRADDIGRAYPGTFMGFHGTGSVILYEDSNKKIRFSHHAVIDELHSDVEPLQRCPAAKLLHRQDVRTGRMLHDIQASVEMLDITNSRWELHGVRIFHVTALTATGQLGCGVRHDSNVGRLLITRVASQGPLDVALHGFNAIGRYLLNINGVDVYTVAGLTHAVAGIHSCAVNSLAGITVLIGKLPDDTSIASTPHHQFAVHNINKLTEIWAIDNMSRSSSNTSTKDIAPIDYATAKPPSWQACMRGPDKERWIYALHTFMEKCRPYSTFSLPIVPPPGATVLNLVIVLKYALDEFQRLKEFKLRLCAHGGQSVAGKDYDMSFAPAPVSASLRLMVANYAWLKGVHPTLRCLHYDIRNCFQSVPDKRERIFVKCFPEMWQWFCITYPDLMERIKKKFPGASMNQFACIAWTYLQGQVDASLQWKILNERVLIGELGLTPNRADPCVYSGVVGDHPLIILRATDDYLTLATPESAKIFKRHLTHTPDGKPRWTVNDYGPTKLFFGIRFTESDDAITIDQRPYAFETLSRFLGKNWQQHVGSSSRTEGPWQYGSKFEAALVSSLKTTLEERKLLTQEFGFEFRELLGRFHQLSTWTRPDLTPGTIRMSTFQNAPARIHFSVLKSMLIFLSRFPDRGLTYPKRQCDPVTKELKRGPATLVNNIEVHVGERIESPIEMNYSPVDRSIFRPLDGRIVGVSAIRVTAPPPTEAECDASYGSIYDTSAVAGFHLFMLGTLVHWFSKKLPTPAQSTTEAELLAANESGKILKWERVWMLDIGCPFIAPILMGEDNDSCRIISEGGRLSRQVRHLCIHTDVMQSDSRRGIYRLYRCDSADNSSDHQTKFLAPEPYWKHTTKGMGERFITTHHQQTLEARNCPDSKKE